MGLFPNRYPGVCPACRTAVASSAGFAFKRGGRWSTVCNSAACARILGLAASAAAAVDTRRVLESDGTVRLPYDPAAMPLVRAFPGARWNPDAKVWRVSLDAGDRARVLEIAEQLRLEIAPELREIPTSDLTQAALARALDSRLFPFQAQGIGWLSRRKRALLADDMGLGKTVQALQALPVGARALVLCPASLKFNWRDECRRWRPDLKPVVLSGDGSFRTPEAGELVIVNYDILPTAPAAPGKDAKVASDEQPCPFAMGDVFLIVDEATLVKNSRTARARAVAWLSRGAGACWFLSGTPLENRPLDLWGILCAGHMARDVFGGWNTFTRLFRAYKNQFGGWEFSTPGPEVPERLRRVMLRRKKEDVLPELPALTTRDVLVNSIPPALKRQLDRAWESWCEDSDGDPDALPDFEEFSAIRAALAKSRIPALLELVEQYEDASEPLVVFSAHRAPIDTLAARAGWAAITGDTNPEQRTEIVRRFQAGELRGVALTIRAGGVGLTLTKASHMVFVDLDWVPSWNAQACDRIRRIGQMAASLHVTRLVSDHALDLRVLRLIDQKLRMIAASVETRATYKPRIGTPRVGAAFVQETDEEQRARAAAIEAAAGEADREEQRGRVNRRLVAERSRATAPERELTSQVIEAIAEAFAYMQSVCDGAHKRDGAGFSKPDAATAALLERFGLGDETAARTAERMLCRYHRQLSGRFPILFREVRAVA